MSKTFVIAEVGINHNGDIEIAKKLIKGAKEIGANAVKFQKRTINLVYDKVTLDRYRESPWGTTYGDQKERLEFGRIEYDIINAYCKMLQIDWFASAWDLESQKFLKQYDLKYNKIASAMLTHKELLEMVAKEHKYTFISTGMSTMDEIEDAVNIFIANSCPYELMHCNSQYPMPDNQANLNCIKTLRDKFNCKVGYSGHEEGLIPTVIAVAFGATSIERHITLNRTMYGTDQASSVELSGFRRLIHYIIDGAEVCMGDGKKIVTDAEKECQIKLRRTCDLL